MRRRIMLLYSKIHRRGPLALDLLSAQRYQTNDAR